MVDICLSFTLLMNFGHEIISKNFLEQLLRLDEGRGIYTSLQNGLVFIHKVH